MIRKEPEHTALELAKFLLGQIQATAADIRGISYIQNGRPCHNLDRDLIADLDALPLPSRNLIDNSKYIMPATGRGFTIIKTSRGCPYKCTFCTTTPYYNTKWRSRSAANIFEELKECVEKYQLKDFMFLSDTFNANNRIVKDLCKMIIDAKLDIHWVSNSKADLINDLETLKLMKKAGCWLVSVGFESGSQKILDSIKKQATLEQYYRAIELLNQARIKILGYFVVGMPGESRETLEETYRFLETATIDYAHFYHATPFPGTKFYEFVRQNNYLLTDDWSQYFHGDRPLVSYPDLTPADLEQAVQKCYRKVYYNPRRVMKELFSMDTVTNFVPKVRTAWNLLRYIERP